MPEPLLQVRDLRVEFRSEGAVVKAVDGVSFDLQPGRTLGIVGESGSGKSVTNLAILRLVPDPPGRIAGGSIRFAGRISVAPERAMRALRGKRIAMIFQDPMTSLNPTCGEPAAGRGARAARRLLACRIAPALDRNAGARRHSGCGKPHRPLSRTSSAAACASAS
jgi:ABC-type oligopeptide transport system ATPase subunit